MLRTGDQIQEFLQYYSNYSKMFQLEVEGTGDRLSETRVLFKIFPPTEVLTIMPSRDSPAEFSEPVEGEEGVELKVR